VIHHFPYITIEKIAVSKNPYLIHLSNKEISVLVVVDIKTLNVQATIDRRKADLNW